MKTRYVALAVAATLGLGSVSAFAQDHHRGNRGQQSWQQHQSRNWSHNNRYVAPRYYGPSYNYRRNDSGDVAGALVLGALAGALVGQASNSYYAPPATYYAPPATYYAPPATYYAPPATYYAPPATYYNSGYGYYGN